MIVLAFLASLFAQPVVVLPARPCVLAVRALLEEGRACRRLASGKAWRACQVRVRAEMDAALEGCR